jgi:hypothetical protein
MDAHAAGGNATTPPSSFVWVDLTYTFTRPGPTSYTTVAATNSVPLLPTDCQNLAAAIVAALSANVTESGPDMEEEESYVAQQQHSLGLTSVATGLSRHLGHSSVTVSGDALAAAGSVSGSVGRTYGSVVTVPNLYPLVVRLPATAGITPLGTWAPIIF